MRWRLDLAYDGAGFSGWAAQPGRRTVEGELGLWLGRVLRQPEPPALVCAGRTDAGVHARGQVAHVDLPSDVDGGDLVRRLRRALPDDVVVWSMTPAPVGFDARFSAIWRRYVYRLGDGGRPVDPLARHQVGVVRETLDLEVLGGAAAELLGLRDFVAFCRQREGATTIRTLLELTAVRDPGGLVEITVRADAFCHSMVRSLVGALVELASGRRDLDWLVRTRDAGHRSHDVHVMPAHGLTLEEVGYPPDAELGLRAAKSRTRRDSAEESRTRREAAR